jgi:hypothetical protein
MQCIAALDYSHLDNEPFLLSLAQSVSGCANFHPLIIHGSSSLTERIIQQGVMRDEAEVQCIKTLNHRLVNLFADESVSALGIHAYQKKAITFKNDRLHINCNFFNNLPPVSIFLSTLVWNADTESVKHVELPRMAHFIQKELSIEPVYCFKMQENRKNNIHEKFEEVSWGELPRDFAEKYIPPELQNYNQPLRLLSVQSFGDSARKNRSVFIH